MFEARLCMSTSMLPLTLLIWGICRTLGGPAFEPLISRARNNVHSSARNPLGEYSVIVRARHGVVDHAWGSCGMWPGACGAGAPLEAALSGRQSGMGGRRMMGCLLQCACTPSVTSALQLVRVRAGFHGRAAQPVVTARSSAFNAVDLGRPRRIRLVPRL